MTTGDEWEQPKFRLNEEAGEFFSEHVGDLCDRWGMPEAESLLRPETDRDYEYQPKTPREAGVFGAAVRDARRRVEEEGYNFDREEAGEDPDHDEFARKEDASIAAALKKVEHAIRRNYGRIPSIEDARGFTAWVLKQRKEAEAKRRRTMLMNWIVISVTSAMMLGGCMVYCT